MMQSKGHISAVVPSQPDNKEKTRRYLALAKAMTAHTKKPLAGLKADSVNAGEKGAMIPARRD
jgi:hypothetical protein